MGLIVGVVIGAVAFLLLVALIAAAAIRKRRARRQSRGLLGEGYHSKTTSTNGEKPKDVLYPFPVATLLQGLKLLGSVFDCYV